MLFVPIFMRMLIEVLRIVPTDIVVEDRRRSRQCRRHQPTRRLLRRLWRRLQPPPLTAHLPTLPARRPISAAPPARSARRPRAEAIHS